MFANVKTFIFGYRRGEEEISSLRVGTADLLYMLTQHQPDVDFTLALGTDTYIDLASGKWKRTEDIFRMVGYRTIIFRRKEEDNVDNNEKEQLLQKRIAQWQLINATQSSIRVIEIPTLTEVSSSVVRKSTDETALRAMLSNDVLEYITHNQMYALSDGQADKEVADGPGCTKIQKKKMPAYKEVPFTLTQKQWQWLEDMATKHKLSSMSKAVRCCINCVALEDAADSLSSTDTTFESEQAEQHSIAKQVELSTEQQSWLETKQKENNNEHVVQRMIQSCMETDEYTVFGIIRCKSSIAKCCGSLEARKNIGEKYDQKEDEVVVKENIEIMSKDCGCEEKT